MLKDFIRDYIRYIPSKLLPGLFGIVSIPIMTKLFNPDEYGQYVIIISTIAILAIIGNDWIGTSVIRFYPEHLQSGETGLFNSTVFRITLISLSLMAAICFIALAMLMGRVAHTTLISFFIGILILAFTILYNVILQLLVAKRKPNIYSFLTIWRQVVCILIGFAIIIVFDNSVNGLLLGILLGLVFVAPVVYFPAFEEVSIRRYSSQLTSKMISYGSPLVITNLAAWILALSDRYIIGIFRGNYEVGLYSISYSLTDRSLMLIVSLLIITSQPIVMGKWEQNGEEATGRFLKELTRFYMIVTFPAAVGLSLLANPIIKVLSSSEYHAGYRIVPLVAVSIFLFGLQRNFQLAFLFHKKTKIIMYLVLSSGLINLLSNIVFVPRYGYMGAGYTTLVSYFIFSAATILMSRRYFAWEFPFLSSFKVVAATLAMSVIVKLIVNLQLKYQIYTLILGIGSGAMTYVLILFLLKELNKDSIAGLFGT